MSQVNSLNFTIDSINALPIPTKGVATFKDTQNPSLQLYLTPGGAKTFFIRKRIRGRDQRIRVGRFPALSISQARSQAILIGAEIEKGLDPLAEKRKAAAKAITLGEQAAIYIERHCKQRNKDWKKREKEVAKYLKPLLNCPLSTITREDVERIQFNIGKKAPVMANRIMSLFRSIFNYAIKKGWEGKNPAQGFERFKEVSRDRFVLPDEMPFLLQAIDEEKNSLAKDFFKILLLTGARKTNVQQMRWEQIDWTFGYWRIPETKNGQPLILPLTEKALDILNQRKQESDSQWVFPQRNNPKLSIVAPQKAWNRIRATATLLYWSEHEKLKELITKVQKSVRPSSQLGNDKLIKRIIKQAIADSIDLQGNMLDVRIHDLRRTFGSYQALTGASLQIIGKSLGHKSTQATQIYARLNLDAVRSAVEKGIGQMFAASAL